MGRGVAIGGGLVGMWGSAVQAVIGRPACLCGKCVHVCVCFGHVDGMCSSAGGEVRLQWVGGKGLQYVGGVAGRAGGCGEQSRVDGSVVVVGGGKVNGWVGGRVGVVMGWVCGRPVDRGRGGGNGGWVEGWARNTMGGMVCQGGRCAIGSVVGVTRVHTRPDRINISTHRCYTGDIYYWPSTKNTLL